MNSNIFSRQRQRVSPPLQPNAPLACPADKIALTVPSMMSRPLAKPTILVFDSGLGGLTVFREVKKVRPDAVFVYAADDALFPYGAVEEPRLVARVLSLMESFLAEHRPNLVVVACNTASTLVLPALRQRFSVPFVGTVPAIKPACAASITKRVSVLGTEATVRREYTQALIRQFAADCVVTLVGSPRLAHYAELELAGAPVEDDALWREIEPCFVDSGVRTDTVVLACTHYPLLMERLERLAPWPVRWLDPAPAIARRVVELVGPRAGSPRADQATATFTSGRPLPPQLAAALSSFGLGGAAASGGRSEPNC